MTSRALFPNHDPLPLSHKLLQPHWLYSSHMGLHRWEFEAGVLQLTSPETWLYLSLKQCLLSAVTAMFSGCFDSPNSLLALISDQEFSSSFHSLLLIPSGTWKVFTFYTMWNRSDSFFDLEGNTRRSERSRTPSTKLEGISCLCEGHLRKMEAGF